MPALIILGSALVVFGGLVLLRFPDRPGGRIAWHGAEVSSLGAGLPLIVVGVVAVALGSLQADDAPGDGGAAPAVPSPTSANTGGCVARYLADIPAERKDRLGVGAFDRIVIAPGEDKRPPIGLELTDRGEPVGAVKVSYDPDGTIFYVDGVVDGACDPVPPDAYGPEDDDGRLDTWGRWDEVCIDFGPHAYVLRLGADQDIRFGFARAAGECGA